MVTDLDAPLVKFSADPRDWWTLRDAVRGVQIFGGIGSGKSSGSGRTLALSFLKAGFGGLVLTGKVDETARWVGEYAALARRSGDVVVFGPDSELRFNPLAYEMGRSGPGGGETANVVALFSTLMRLGGRAGSGGGGEASDPFRSGVLARHFAADSSPEVMPEATFDGKIVILDFPVKQYLQVGVYAQAVYKRVWQQAVERRDVHANPRPVFLWVDEAQYFLGEDDMMFQTTARSSRACTVMISQNISNYYASVGGAHPRERVDSLLGNLATKVFHANNDHVTNKWAAETIGQTFQEKSSYSIGTMENASFSKALHFQVEPQEFTLLRSGGKAEGGLVDAVVTSTGKRWSNGRNYAEVSFDQNLLP